VVKLKAFLLLNIEAGGGIALGVREDELTHYFRVACLTAVANKFVDLCLTST
jgi:hypothetical protein